MGALEVPDRHRGAARRPASTPNTPVRKNGILIGRVKSIEDKDDGVLLKAEIDGNRPLYAGYEPHVRTTVLGDATIDFFSRRPTPGCSPLPMVRSSKDWSTRTRSIRSGNWAI